VCPFATPLTRSPQVQELYEALRTATLHVANLLNESTQTHRLPPELLTRIFDLAVDPGSEEHAQQVVSLTHVCRYWRTLLLAYPSIWSTVYLKPGNPNVLSVWLGRSQKVPLTVIAEFTDAYEHPPCSYQDTSTAIPTEDDYGLGVCSRHEAVLSLNQLLPHRSRICDLSVLIRFSDPDWDDDEDDDHQGEPTLLYHNLFRKTLPNLQRLDFRASHVERNRYMIPIPESLFAKKLPRLEDLTYLGVAGGLMGTAKNLTSCEIGFWSESAGPTMTSSEELRVLFSNNTTLESLIINECEFYHEVPWAPIATPLTNLKFLKIDCPLARPFEQLLNCIHIPQFKDIDTVHLSISSSCVEAVATNGSGHTFEFSQFISDQSHFDPLRHFGANITTLRLDRGTTLKRLDDAPTLRELLRSLDAVQVLEFDGSIADFVQNALSTTGVFPGLKILRVTVRRDYCETALQLLAVTSRLRVVGGRPLSSIEPVIAESDGGLDQRLFAMWERCYNAEGIQNLLSK
jgi:hypothetical protein